MFSSPTVDNSYGNEYSTLTVSMTLVCWMRLDPGAVEHVDPAPVSLEQKTARLNNHQMMPMIHLIHVCLPTVL